LCIFSRAFFLSQPVTIYVQHCKSFLERTDNEKSGATSINSIEPDYVLGIQYDAKSPMVHGVWCCLSFIVRQQFALVLDWKTPLEYFRIASNDERFVVASSNRKR
jgi:hypothetical protein